MIWGFRIVATALVVLAAANALQESPLLRPPLEAARRLESALPAAAAPHVLLADKRIYEAHVTTCPRPLTIAVTSPSFTTRAALLDLAAAGDRTFYAYLDWRAERPDRAAVFWRRVQQPILRALGLSRYKRVREMLFVVEPAGCSVAKTVAWERYWTAPL